MSHARFFRLNADASRGDVALENVFAGPRATACWLIGGGPSLDRLPVDEIAASPVPKMAVNLAGTRLLRPTFWTAYDPASRFLRSTFLDAGVMKFVPARRCNEFVPHTGFPLCDCPNLFFFDRDSGRNCSNLLPPAARGIVDWRDTFVQAIEILYRLGFRVIYLAGCEMMVRPSAEQIQLAAKRGVHYVPRERLQSFVRRCEAAGLPAGELDRLTPGRQYHFGEFKPLQAAANTDEHYFRIVQHLRMSRRSLATAGLRLVSVTPHSRLNDWFDYEPARRVLRRIHREVGDLRTESTAGLYGDAVRRRPVFLCPASEVPPPRPSRPPAKPLLRQIARDPEILAEFEGFEPGVEI